MTVGHCIYIYKSVHNIDAVAHTVSHAIRHTFTISSVGVVG
jgi:hypothetical protein